MARMQIHLICQGRDISSPFARYPLAKFFHPYTCLQSPVRVHDGTHVHTNICFEYINLLSCCLLSLRYLVTYDMFQSFHYFAFLSYFVVNLVYCYNQTARARVEGAFNSRQAISIFLHLNLDRLQCLIRFVF